MGSTLTVFIRYLITYIKDCIPIITGHETTKVGSFMAPSTPINLVVSSCIATFRRGRVVAMKLPRSVVWEPKVQVCWKPAMKLPKLAIWEHQSHHGWSKWLKSSPTAKVGSLRAESLKVLNILPWSCQGWQFESTKKGLVQTAEVSSSIVTFSNQPIWQVCPSVIIYPK